MASAADAGDAPAFTLQEAQAALRMHATALETGDLSNLSEALVWVSSVVGAAHRAVATKGSMALADGDPLSRWLLLECIPRTVGSMWSVKYPAWVLAQVHGLFNRVLALVADVLPFAECCPLLISAARLLLGSKDVKLMQSLLSVGGFTVPRPTPEPNASGVTYIPQPTMFHSFHGRPFSRFIALSKATYWPDQLAEAQAKGERSIGSRVLLPVTTYDDGRSHVTHRPARVARYCAESNEHLVYYEDDSSVVWESFNARQVIEQDWVEDVGNPLTASPADVGRAIEVYWAGNRRYYAGVIGEFVTKGEGEDEDPMAPPNPEAPTGYRVDYTDGEVKWYTEANMTVREYRMVRMLPRHIPAADFADGLGDGLVDDPATFERPRADVRQPEMSDSPFVGDIPLAPERFTKRQAAAMFAPSMFLTDAINHFGHVGGFHAMLDRLNGTPALPPFWLLNDIMQIVYDIHSVLEPAVFAAIMATVRNTVFPTVLGLDHQSMKVISRDALHLLSKVMELLLSRAPVAAGDCSLPDPGADSDEDVPTGVAFEATQEDVSAANLSVNTFRLNLARKLLGTPQLEKRLAGLNDICAAVEVASRNAATFRAMASVPPLGSPHGLPFPYPDYMVDWLLEHRVIEELFGAGLHAELARRSGPVMNFLAEQRRVTPSHLDAVWTAARGKHEAVARVLYQLLVGQVRWLDQPSRLYLAKLIWDLPFSEWNVFIVTMVRDFALAACEQDRLAGDAWDVIAAPPPTGGATPTGGLARYGLDLLWRYIQDDPKVGIPVDAIEEAINHIVAMVLFVEGQLSPQAEVNPSLQLPDRVAAATALKHHFVAQCVANLEAHASVPQSLRLMQRIIDTFPRHSRSWFAREKNTVSAVLEALQQKPPKGQRLLDLFFSNLQLYQQVMISKLGVVKDQMLSKALAAAEDDMVARTVRMSEGHPNGTPVPASPGGGGRAHMPRTPDDIHVDANTVKLDGTRYSHADQVEARVAFLNYVLFNSGVEMVSSERDHLLVLWMSLVQGALTKPTLDHAMKWLGKASYESSVGGDGYVAFSDDVDKDLFGRMCSWLSGGGTAPTAATKSMHIRSTTPELFPGQHVVSELSPTCARVFMQFLVACNVRSGALKIKMPEEVLAAPAEDALTAVHVNGSWVTLLPSAVGSRPYLKRCSVDVAGLEHLWQLALTASDPLVGDAATSLLVSLHVNVATKLNKHREKLVASFMHNSLSHVQASAAHLAATGSVSPSAASGAPPRVASPSETHTREAYKRHHLRVLRAVSALKLLLDQFKTKPTTRVPLDIRAVMCVTDRQEVVTLTVDTAATVGALKDAAATRCGLSSKDLELRLHSQDQRHNTSTTVLGDDTAAVQSFGLSTTKPVTVVLRSSHGADEALPVLSPAAEAELTGGYALPDYCGLEHQVVRPSVDSFARGHSSPTPSPLSTVTLADDIDPKHAASAVDVDLLPPKDDIVLSRAPGGTGRGMFGGSHRASAGAGGTPAFRLPLGELVSAESFAQLFGLLTVDAEIGQAVWGLLQLLPTNGAKLHQVRSIDASVRDDWGACLDPRSAYSLLYTLQIVDAFLQPPPQTTGLRSPAGSRPDAPRAEWIARFVQLGGLGHLQHLIAQFSVGAVTAGNLPADACARLSTLAYLFRVTQAFLSLDAHFVHAGFDGVGVATDDPAGGMMTYNLRAVLDLPEGSLVGVMDLPALVRGVVSATSMVRDVQRAARRLRARGVKSSTAAGLDVESGNSVVCYGMHLLVSCILSRQDCLHALVAHPQLPSWLKYYTLQAPATARFAACQALHRVARHLPETVSSLSAADFADNPTAVRAVFAARGARSPSSGSSSAAVSVTVTEFLLHHLMALFSRTSRVPHSCGHYFALVAVLLNQHAVHNPVLLDGLHHAGADVFAPVQLSTSPLRQASFTRRAESKLDGVAASVAEGKLEEEAGEVGAVADAPAAPKLNLSIGYVFGRAVATLMRHHSVESFHTPGADYVVVGLVTLVHYLVRAVPQLREHPAVPDLITFLYRDCLFPTPEDLGEPRAASAPPAESKAGDTGDDSKLGEAKADDDADEVGGEGAADGDSSHSPDGDAGEEKEAEVAAEEEEDDGNFGPRCKTLTSRRAVHGLLAELVAGPGNVGRLLSLLSTMQDVEANGGMEGRVVDQWDYDPALLLKAPKQYVGLRNQGATCYMNSFLQQLFHIPRFRAGVLMAEDNSTDPTDSVLFQMQVLFGYLQVSQKRWYETRPLCMAFKDYDGLPIRLSEQKDVFEFANMLFDKLEGCNPKVGSLIRDTFGGSFVNQVMSMESDYKSETPEPFNMITLTVKNKANLEESLDGLITADLLSGDNKYQLPDGTKVDAKKRQVVKELPPHLILHLKRFEFDLDTLRKNKVNDFLSFPATLDMRAYTAEGVAAREAAEREEIAAGEEGVPGEDATGVTETKAGEVEEGGDGGGDAPGFHPDWYYQYELRGVLAHTGTADSGHYYSFIKERDGSMWHEFNDRVVRGFREDQLAAEAFGGTYTYRKYDEHTRGYVEQNLPRNNNAYLVIYDRVKPPAEEDAGGATPATPPPLMREASDFSVDGGEDSEMNTPALAPAVAPSQPKELSLGVAATTATMASRVAARLRSFRQRKGWLPPHIMRAVWRENRGFLLDRFLFHPDYFKFIWTLVRTPADGDAAVDTARSLQVQLATRVVLSTAVLARDRSYLRAWFPALRAMFSTSPQSCQWMCLAMAYKTEWLRRLFCFCPHASTRREVAALMVHVVNVLRPFESDRYEARVPVDAADAKLPAYYTEFMPASPVALFMDAVVNTLCSGDQFLRHLTELFKLLLDMSALGMQERRALLTNGDLVRLIDFYTMEHAAYFDSRGEKLTRASMPSFSMLAQVIASLVLCCHLDESQGATPGAVSPDAVDRAQLPLPPRSQAKVLHKDFLHQLTKEDPDQALRVLRHLSFLNTDLSNKLVTLVRTGLLGATQGRINPPDLRAYFKVLQGLLVVDDPLAEMRAEWSLPWLVERSGRVIERQSDGDTLYLYLTSRLLLSMSMRSVWVRQFMVQHKSEWGSWLERWKDERRMSRSSWGHYGGGGGGYSTAHHTRTAPATPWFPSV